MTRLNAANNAQALLVGDITAVATSFYVDDASVFPAAPFLITIDDEIILVNTVLSNLFSNVTRAQEGTTAATHSGDSLVENRWTAAMYKVLSDNTPLNNFAATTNPGVSDDSGDGYSVGSRWINTTLDKAYTCLDATAGAAVWQESGAGGVKNNFTATADPAVTDDSSDGYSVGSTWVNLTLDAAYVCLDATAGAAVWEKISGLAAHSAETVSHVVAVARDMTIEGTQTVSGLPFRPKWISVYAFVGGSKKESKGFWSPVAQYGSSIAGDSGFIYTTAGVVDINDTTASYTTGSIGNVTNNSFDIVWTKGGAGATGTAALRFLIGGHY